MRFKVNDTVKHSHDALEPYRLHTLDYKGTPRNDRAVAEYRRRQELRGVITEVKDRGYMEAGYRVRWSDDTSSQTFERNLSPAEWTR